MMCQSGAKRIALFIGVIILVLNDVINANSNEIDDTDVGGLC